MTETSHIHTVQIDQFTDSAHRRDLPLSSIDTPAVVVDLDRVERNIARFQHYLNTHRIDNRPHIKTHKIPALAKLQLASGAVGITCQKIGEAEVMADAGILDLFIPYNIIGGQKLDRLVALARRAKVSVTADSEYVVNGYADSVKGTTLQLPVLIEVDTGAKRAGVQTPEQAADLARFISRMDGLQFGGLMTYPNDPSLDPFVERVKSLLENDNITVERVSGGSTPGMWHAHERTQLNEYRAGMYIYGDRYILNSGAMQPEDVAFHVLVTVVSRPTPDRGIIDGGSKTFSSDTLGLEGYGHILEYPEAKVYAFSEEHGHVDFSACQNRPQVGERLTIIPNHCCVVTNLFDEIHARRGDRITAVYPVAARGKLR